MEYMENVGRRSPADIESEGLILRKKFQWLSPGVAPLFSIFFVCAALFAWEMCVSLGYLSALFFPPPSRIFPTLIRLTISGSLPVDVAITLSRLLQGGVIGGFSGLALGLLMGWAPRLRFVIDPFIAAIHPMPKVALLPLVMIVFGIGEVSKVVAISLSTFFPMLINTMVGVRQINPSYFEVAQNYGAPFHKIFLRVVLPGSLPMILTGVRLALNGALVITIAVELLTAQKGLGAIIWGAWQTLRVDELYVALLVTALLGMGFNKFLQKIEYRLIHWQR